MFAKRLRGKGARPGVQYFSQLCSTCISLLSVGVPERTDIYIMKCTFFVPIIIEVHDYFKIIQTHLI